MRFDITNIDKNLLLRALFAYSSPIGYGKEEYKARKSWNENVEGLTDLECDQILSEFNLNESGVFYILDYHKGKPMKLNFYRKTTGQVIVDSEAYDVRNQKYRFLEALLDTFDEEEIIIIKKSYREFTFLDLPKNKIRTYQEDKIFRDLIKNSIKNNGVYGRYWSINSEKSEYTSPAMKLFMK